MAARWHRCSGHLGKRPATGRLQWSPARRPTDTGAGWIWQSTFYGCNGFSWCLMGCLALHHGVYLYLRMFIFFSLGMFGLFVLLSVGFFDIFGVFGLPWSGLGSKVFGLQYQYPHKSGRIYSTPAQKCRSNIIDHHTQTNGVEIEHVLCLVVARLYHHHI